MRSSAKKGVQILITQCVEMGLKHVVISPGSRNAPLIIAFNQHPEITTTVIPDERSAAFYALGMAQQLKQPVGILCTSGSAPLNYYPAIAEAYYQGVPMIVFTADRPHAWVDQGDGQTIVQHEVFRNHIRYSVTVPEGDSHKDFNWFLSRELSAAFYHATGPVKGPVHINLPFSEPLYLQSELELTANDVKTIEVLSPATRLSTSQWNVLKATWDNAPRRMIVCGQLEADSALLNALKSLAQDPSVAILVENTSNLADYGFSHCIDRTLNSISEAEKAEFAPDLLITIGGAVVSKRIKKYLRDHAPAHHWKVGYEFLFMDTYQSLTQTIPTDGVSFFNDLLQYKSDVPASNYGARWKQKDFLIQQKAQEFFETNENYGDIAVFNTILDYVPDASHLHMANSSVIRYCQLFDPVPGIQYWSNRGTSGIDGSTSTACGAAMITTDTWHTLITGDMSFFYDSNALWNHVLTPNLRIFMINNGGGGIFKIIPGPKDTQELEDFFVFNHAFSAEYICKAFDIAYFKAENIADIENQMETFYAFEEEGKPKLMEIFTPAGLNDLQLENYFAQVKL
jgi:2-succinyl-5-enolpyruvyl-6-hydroxy-3-cyclohexene-1-carboxylate synthase